MKKQLEKRFSFKEVENEFILEWNKDLIRYSHNVGGYDHTHTLNRITGRVDGEAICFKSYGRAF